MQLKEDEYILNIGSWTRVMSRSESRARLKKGYEKKCREEPGWQKIARAKADIQWSVEDRLEQSAKMKALWASDEYAERREAARQRLNAARANRVASEHAREVTSQRMLLGGARDAVKARKIMQPEAVAERTERDANIVRNYYAGKMKATEIAKLYNLEISWVYRILRTVQMD